MRIVATERFKRARRSLPEQLLPKIKKALRLLASDPRHPSLQLKKIRSAPGVWESRIDRACRMTLEIRSDCYALRNIGKHDETLSNP